MSNDSNHNLALNKIRHLDNKLKEINEEQYDFFRSKTAGENPDPNEFVKLLEKQSVTGTAMAAQFSLIQKPLKTVLTDSH